MLATGRTAAGASFESEAEELKADEAEPAYLSGAMGLYIAGNAVGGMTGRIGTAWLAAVVGWREAVLITGAFCLLLGVLFIVLLPASRRFERRPLRLWETTQ